MPLRHGRQFPWDLVDGKLATNLVANMHTSFDPALYYRVA